MNLSPEGAEPRRQEVPDEPEVMDDSVTTAAEVDHHRWIFSAWNAVVYDLAGSVADGADPVPLDDDFPAPAKKPEGMAALFIAGEAPASDRCGLAAGAWLTEQTPLHAPNISRRRQGEYEM